MLIADVSKTRIIAALPGACFIFIFLSVLSGTVYAIAQDLGKQIRQFSEDVPGDVEKDVYKIINYSLNYPKMYNKEFGYQKVLVTDIYNLNNFYAKPLNIDR